MILFIALVIACLAIDQVTKWLIVLKWTSDIVVIKDFFKITSVRNIGAAFSMPIPTWAIFSIIGFVSVAIIIIAAKSKLKTNKWLAVTLAFILSGALGNFCDRLFQADHQVVDFLSFTLYYPWFESGHFVWGSYPFAVFNMADSFLVVGAIMAIIYLIFIEPKRSKDNGKDNI